MGICIDLCLTCFIAFIHTYVLPMQEYSPEIAYLFANLLSFMEASDLADVIVGCAKDMLRRWRKWREARVESNDLKLSHNEAYIFATLEASWAELFVDFTFLFYAVCAFGFSF